MKIKWQAKYKAVVPHLLFWLAYIFYQAIIYGWENTDALTFQPGQALFTATLPVNILLTYLNLYVLMPLFYYRQEYVRYAISLVLILLIGGILARFLTHTFIVPWEKLHNPVRYGLENKNFWIPVRILRLSLETCPLIAVTMVIQLMRNAYEREKNLRDLQKEKFAAEMALLKTQINPHFFFNTLNTLYGLILKKSEKAAKFALRLSDLMHYLLYEASAEKVLLTDEISHLENYINVEQMRFADRLELSFQFSGEITGKLIAPLILLPFVENAFKHGISNNSGWITININVVQNRLFLNVENSCPINSQISRGGLGLNNVKRRLELTYPGKYDLQVSPQTEVFEVTLKLYL
ncbi:sensor histidine kinase [Mucilaginibacter jinjuensis]|uniref:Histidine kinase n=1 Tax=Mucilaginibacter jinjuensis TaxID=1176721 RepID=A0ABY7T9Q8_9SPHI|nr:histidine kinase [Mucilaginibacter jinjuensis]WCT13097.1 histidine kinase [Mucilaginibacter jinjuensis]